MSIIKNGEFNDLNVKHCESDVIIKQGSREGVQSSIVISHKIVENLIKELEKFKI